MNNNIMKKMKDTSITDFFTAIKEEPDFESYPHNSITSEEFLAQIKSEPRCYVKEETDIPFDDTYGTDSNDDPWTKIYSGLNNRTCSIVIEKLSDSIVQKYHRSKTQSEKITQEPTRNAVVIDITKDSILNNGQKSIVECNDVKKKYKDCKQFYGRICPKCNKKSPAASIVCKCVDCKVDLNYECLKCHKQLTSHQGISSHVKLQCHNAESNYYKCFKCDFKSLSKYYVKRHIKKLHSDSVFHRSSDKIARVNSKNVQFDEADECTKCEKKFLYFHVLLKHAQKCNGSKAIAENENESSIKRNKDPKELSTDYSVVKSMMLRYCRKCDEEASVDTYGCSQKTTCIKCHVPLTYKCKTCQKYYSTRVGTITHVLSNHVAKRKWSCPKCTFKAVSLLYLTAHYRRMHNPKSFYCEKCNKSFKSQMLLSRHLVKCNSEPKFQCEDCPYRAYSQKHLIQHIRNKHSSENHGVVCKQCKGVYKHLTTHLRVFCGKEATIQCDYCSYKTKRKQCVKMHIIRHHMGEPQIFECSKCKRTFTSQKRLENHLICCKAPKRRC